jgi:hypothetical protein
MNIIKDSYENGECPDCGKDIPDDVSGGDGCSNCGHVFYGRPDYGKQEEKNVWIQANQARIDELAEEYIERMDMSSLVGFAKDALESGWSLDQADFEIQWNEYLEER